MCDLEKVYANTIYISNNPIEKLTMMSRIAARAHRSTARFEHINEDFFHLTIFYMRIYRAIHGNRLWKNWSRTSQFD